MKILQEYGTFRYVDPKEEALKEQLMVIEDMTRTCYQSYRGPITMESASSFCTMLMRVKHTSQIEHGTMKVKFSDVSRGFTHEFVRHRIPSYSQESTRYVDYIKGDDKPDLDRFQLKVVLPRHKDLKATFTLEDGRQMTAEEMAIEEEKFYRALRKGGWKPEDARQLLPNGMKTELGVSTNFKEWRHIFGLRTDKAAHWEIREVLGRFLERTKELVPIIFDDFQKAGVDQNGVPYYEMVKGRW